MTSLPGFFALTYLVAWTLWIAAARFDDLRALLFTSGTFAPGIVALALTALKEGSGGLRTLLGRMVHWRVPAKWYVFALAYVIVIKLLVAVIHRVAIGAWPQFGGGVGYVLLGLLAVLALFWSQAGEEIGWRGYALPRLATRLGLARASLVLGVIWAAWHLPLFLIPDTTTTGQSFPLYLLQVTALSVAMTWLYAHTKGSLLLVMLLHSAVNNTKDIVPSAAPDASNPFVLSGTLVAWLSVALLWIGAAYFLARMPAPQRDPTGAPTGFGL